jgi:hypothetical protein
MTFPLVVLIVLMGISALLSTRLKDSVWMKNEEEKDAA